MCNVVSAVLSCSFDGFPTNDSGWPTSSGGTTIYKKQWDYVTGIKAALDEINGYLANCLTNYSSVLHTNNTNYVPYKNATYDIDASGGTVNSATNITNYEVVNTCAAELNCSYTRSVYAGSATYSANNSGHIPNAHTSYSPTPTCTYNATSRTANGCSVYNPNPSQACADRTYYGYVTNNTSV